MVIYILSRTQEGAEMKVYNRKKEPIGWVSEQGGKLVFSRFEDDGGKVYGGPKRNSLYSVLYSMLFWMLAGEALGFFGYPFFVLTSMEVGTKLPFTWVLSSTNSFYMAPMGFVIQFAALLFVSIRYRRFLSVSAICLGQAVLALLTEYGVLVFDRTVFIISVLLALLVATCLGILYVICLRNDLLSGAEDMGFWVVLVILVFLTAFVIVLCTAFSYEITAVNASGPVEILPEFGTLTKRDSFGKALLFFQSARSALYIIGILILRQILEEETAFEIEANS